MATASTSFSSGFSQQQHLADCLDKLSIDARDLYITSNVPTLESVPTPLHFYRDWVSPNLPVVIQGAIDNWPALSRWTNLYLRKKVGETEVTVAVTPDGYADSVTDERFMLPEERVMTFSEFLNVLENRCVEDGIHYIQKQNSNLTDELSPLLEDAASHLSWATESFGSPPDAVNFWMGDKDSISSMHKDHYENLYCVIKGQKTFTLLPPTDQAYIPYELYPAARYRQKGDKSWDRDEVPELGMVPWIPVDPLDPDFNQYPEFEKARTIQVTLNAGDTLYLPSLWFHHVQQSHGCIAVNFWYDMEYDMKFNYFKFVENLTRKNLIGS